MCYYKKPVYQITNHVLKRFQERHPEKLISSEARSALLNMLDNTFEGMIYENGDRKLISFDCPSTYFIVTKDNVLKTFIKKK